MAASRNNPPLSFLIPSYSNWLLKLTGFTGRLHLDPYRKFEVARPDLKNEPEEKRSENDPEEKSK